MMRLLTSMLLIIAAGAALALMHATTPSYAVLTGPLETVGAQREPVASAAFSVKANKVLRSQTLSFKRFGRDVSLDSQGMFVVVSADAETKRETMQLRAAAIMGTSGRLYRQSHRADGAPQAFSDKTLQPGLPASGLFIFEMPEAEMADMTLVVSRQEGPQLDAEIHIHLDQNGIETRKVLEIGDNGL